MRTDFRHTAPSNPGAVVENQLKLMKLIITPQVARFNAAVECADLLLGPQWAWATVDQLIVELCRRKLFLSATELKAAAREVGELEEPICSQ